MAWGEALIELVVDTVAAAFKPSVPAHGHEQPQSDPGHWGWRLSRLQIFLIWVVAIVAMGIAWRLGTQSSDSWIGGLALLLLIGAPVGALVVTIWARNARGRL